MSTKSIPANAKCCPTLGHPYGEIGRVRVVDTRSHSAIAQVEFSCDPINPGDVAMPFVEKAADRLSRARPFRSLRARQWKAERTHRARQRLRQRCSAPGMKLYLNMGSNQGVKVGDYFRVVRSYTADLARSGRLALVQDLDFGRHADAPADL